MYNEAQSRIDDLFKPHKEVGKPIYYTFNGKEDKIVDGLPIHTEKRKNSYACQSGEKYSIRIDDRGNFFNPIGMYTQSSKNERWVNVSKTVFDHYLAFLKTGNKIQLIHAEREM